jgi:Lar family restriction alleviation protein
MTAISEQVALCPFCGFDDVEYTELVPGQIQVECPECGAMGPYGDTPSEATRQWNLPHGPVT